MAAFTLIEMLAVIAVVGILAALLFPVLGKSQDRADSVGCLASLRNIGMGISLYVADNNGTLPGPINRGQSANYGMGPNSLLYHIGFYMGLGERPETIGVEKVALCPGFHHATGSDEGVCWWTNQEAVVEGSTTRVNPWGHPASLPEPGKPIRALRIASPSRQMALQDVDQELGIAWAGIPAKPVHDGLRHRLYFDWHAAPAPASLGRNVMPDN